MKQFSNWLGTRSYLTTVLIFAVIWGVGTQLVSSLLDGKLPSAVDLVFRAISAIIFGLIIAAVFRRNTRRGGGVSESRRITEAVKSGSLPPDVRVAEWLPALRYQEQQLARSIWLVPVAFGLFALLGVFVAVTADDLQGLILGLIVGLGFIGFAVWVLVNARRRLPVVRRFIGELDR